MLPECSCGAAVLLDCVHARNGIRSPEAGCLVRVTVESPPWWIDAADLLAEPDPGPTPWLVEGLIVDQAIVAAVGK